MLTPEFIRENLTKAMLVESSLPLEEHQAVIDYCAEIGPQLTNEWQNVSRNDIHKKKPHYNPELLRVAETLAHYGLAEVDYRPVRVEKRRDPLTDVVSEVGLGCRCFVRAKQF